VTAYEDCIFRPGAQFAASLAERMAECEMPPDTFLNVNVPNICGEDLGPAMLTRLGRREYINSLERREDPRGRSYYWFSGEPQECDCAEGTDIGAIQSGRVSVTPVHFDMNFRGERGEIEALLDGLVE
jgi:5'-nucleotidase